MEFVLLAYLICQRGKKEENWPFFFSWSWIYSQSNFDVIVQGSQYDRETCSIYWHPMLPGCWWAFHKGLIVNLIWLDFWTPGMRRDCPPRSSDCDAFSKSNFSFCLTHMKSNLFSKWQISLSLFLHRFSLNWNSGPFENQKRKKDFGFKIIILFLDFVIQWYATNNLKG